MILFMFASSSLPVLGMEEEDFSLSWEEGYPASWAIDSIALLKKMKWLTPTLYKDYEEAITRLEFVTGLVDYYEFVSEEEIVYPEEQIYGDNNSQVVLKANALGMTTGKETSEAGDLLFMPDDSLTRQEMATFLIRMMTVLKSEEIQRQEEFEYTPFIDDPTISVWAKEAVYESKLKGYLDGVGENVFEPLRRVTKQEALVMLAKVLKQENSHNMKYVLLFSMEVPKNYLVAENATLVQADYGKYGEPLFTLDKDQTISIFRKMTSEDGRQWGMTANYTWIELDKLVESESLYDLRDNYDGFLGLLPERQVLDKDLKPLDFVQAVNLEGKGYVFYDDKGEAWLTEDNKFYYIGREMKADSFKLADYYTELSQLAKIEYLLSEMGFDTQANEVYDVDTASDLIVFQSFMKEFYGTSVDGNINTANIEILEKALKYGITYRMIRDLYIEFWEPPAPSVEKDLAINGRLGDVEKVNLVRLPVRYDQMGYSEESTAIGWAMLVHEGKYKSLGVEDTFFYLTYPESGYRTFQQQVRLFNKYGPGRAAKPGTSNHGWGLALDLNITYFIKDLIAHDQVGLKDFEDLMLQYGFHPLKNSDGTYWEEWHWDYEG